MTQYQTRLPGGARVRRPSTLNIYAGLTLLTFLVLVAGVIFMWLAGMQVAPTDAAHPFTFR